MTMGGYDGKYGDQTPLVSVRPNSSRVRIASAVNGNRRYYKDTDALTLNKWYSLEISQAKVGGSYVYSIKLDGESLIERTNKQAKEFNMVKVYKSNPWLDAADVTIRKFSVTTHK